ncbi:hypothetical protein J2D73_11765 [Acetobacter sacchari]|uniref:DipZ thioredoxin-like C-terminal domain-containing protein n=1 Tax=Acetobacter sacchari TaxID=2661687 RepID=A0ABS3LX02_9PROT|nr:hypothetical protein [Acetobacter sacchari]MBO1360465.1 hypothetical protein [Acetobacter sacchari]
MLDTLRRLRCRIGLVASIMAATGVIGSGTCPITAVLIDGMSRVADHGVNTDADGHDVITNWRLYQLVPRTGAFMDRSFDIRLGEPGADAPSVTFG